MALPSLRDVIARDNLRADKSRGQNFILDSNLLDAIAGEAGDLRGCDVIEIGAGPAGLTRALLKAGAAKVIAIEEDTRFLPALEEVRMHHPQLTIMRTDALQIAPHEIASQGFKIVANLPYNIASPLLVKWLDDAWKKDDWHPAFSSLTLMFQKEVAERVIATPSSSNYGRLSVWVQWLCEAQIVMELPPERFVPPPKIHSALLNIVPRTLPLPAPPNTLKRLLATAFGQRRKMLRVSLKSLCSDAEAVLDEANIEPTARPETLAVAQFCKLASIIKKGENHGDDEKPSNH